MKIILSDLHRPRLGEAKVAKKGTDITIVTYSYMTLEALRCANILLKYGISVEVIDLR